MNSVLEMEKEILQTGKERKTLKKEIGKYYLLHDELNVEDILTKLIKINQSLGVAISFYEKIIARFEMKEEMNDEKVIDRKLTGYFGQCDKYEKGLEKFLTKNIERHGTEKIMELASESHKICQRTKDLAKRIRIYLFETNAEKSKKIGPFFSADDVVKSLRS